MRTYETNRNLAVYIDGLKGNTFCQRVVDPSNAINNNSVVLIDYFQKDMINPTTKIQPRVEEPDNVIEVSAYDLLPNVVYF